MASELSDIVLALTTLSLIAGTPGIRGGAQGLLNYSSAKYFWEKLPYIKRQMIGKPKYLDFLKYSIKKNYLLFTNLGSPEMEEKMWQQNPLNKYRKASSVM